MICFHVVRDGRFGMLVAISSRQWCGVEKGLLDIKEGAFMQMSLPVRPVSWPSYGDYYGWCGHMILNVVQPAKGVDPTMHNGFAPCIGDWWDCRPFSYCWNCSMGPLVIGGNIGPMGTAETEGPVLSINIIAWITLSQVNLSKFHSNLTGTAGKWSLKEIVKAIYVYAVQAIFPRFHTISCITTLQQKWIQAIGFCGNPAPQCVKPRYPEVQHDTAPSGTAWKWPEVSFGWSRSVVHKLKIKVNLKCSN